MRTVRIDNKNQQYDTKRFANGFVEYLYQSRVILRVTYTNYRRYMDHQN